MEQPLRSEVFTADELALAAGVDRAAVDALIASGELRVISSTSFIRAEDAVAAGRRLALARPVPTPLETTRFVTADTTAAHIRRRQPVVPAFASSVLHAGVIAVAIWRGAGSAEVAFPVEEPRTPERLVFLMTPGPGGGGGGGPYRPGAGIEPPRLLREVKPEYTDDARRRGVTGDVLLEVVVRSDGSVGDIRILRALGSGLDQRAVAAVRQWRFAPARGQGQPVDVIVEVAVEFTLR